MARSPSRDTRALLLAVFTAFATLLLSSLALAPASAGTSAGAHDSVDPPITPPDCQNVIYGGKTTAPPACPTNVTVTPGIAQLTVSWMAPANDGGSPVTGYDVQYSVDLGTTWIAAPPNPPSGPNAAPATTNIVSGLTAGTPYIFRVAAVNALGAGNLSPNTDPTTPLGVRASTLSVIGHNKSVVRGSSTTLRVSLTDDADGNIPVPAESVTLHRRIGASGPWHFVRFAQTSKAGVASTVVAPHVTTEFRWTFTSDSAYAPRTSGVQTVAVRRY